MAILDRVQAGSPVLGILGMAKGVSFSSSCPSPGTSQSRVPCPQLQGRPGKSCQPRHCSHGGTHPPQTWSTCFWERHGGDTKCSNKMQSCLYTMALKAQVHGGSTGCMVVPQMLLHLPGLKNLSTNCWAGNLGLDLGRLRLDV